jgi:hypothetical protein
MGNTSFPIPRVSNTPPRVLADYGGRRKIFERRVDLLTGNKLERRSGADRRSGFDRRSTFIDLKFSPEKRDNFPQDIKTSGKPASYGASQSPLLSRSA